MYIYYMHIDTWATISSNYIPFQPPPPTLLPFPCRNCRLCCHMHLGLSRTQSVKLRQSLGESGFVPDVQFGGIHSTIILDCDHIVFVINDMQEKRECILLFCLFGGEMCTCLLQQADHVWDMTGGERGAGERRGRVGRNFNKSYPK